MELNRRNMITKEKYEQKQKNYYIEQLHENNE
jgi:hypothetical protein